MAGRINIIVDGSQGVGKSRFLRDVLIPALLKSDYNYHVTDGGVEVANLSGRKSPTVIVEVTNHGG